MPAFPKAAPHRQPYLCSPFVEVRTYIPETNASVEADEAAVTGEAFVVIGIVRFPLLEGLT